MKKILFLYLGRKGGGPKYTYELVNHLLKNDIKNKYLVYFSNQSEMYKDFNNLLCCKKSINTYSNITEFLISLFKLPYIFFELWRFIRINQVNYIVTPMIHIWDLILLFPMAKYNIKYILIIHDSSPHLGESYIYKNFLINFLLKKSTKIITLTDFVKKELVNVKKINNNKISVIPHGYFNYDSFIKENNGIFNLLFFGVIKKYKGLDFFLDVAKLIQEKYPEVTITIAGSGDLSAYKNKLDLINKLLVHNKWIADNEVGHYFSKSSLVILPYIEASQSGVIPTAYSYGVPVVVTPVGGLKEQVINNITGLITTDISVDSLYHSICQMIDDKELFNACRGHAFEYARNELDWNKIAIKFQKLLENS